MTLHLFLNLDAPNRFMIDILIKPLLGSFPNNQMQYNTPTSSAKRFPACWSCLECWTQKRILLLRYLYTSFLFRPPLPTCIHITTSIPILLGHCLQLKTAPASSAYSSNVLVKDPRLVTGDRCQPPLWQTRLEITGRFVFLMHLELACGKK